MREIVVDTETTGLDPEGGDRVVEIGCVELENHLPTGRHYHAYLNPERDVPADALTVHGLTAEFLADKPVFAEIASDLVTFLGEAKLVIHNAAFDIAFLNHELAGAGCRPIGFDRVVDSLELARARHPFGPNSLDALCRRYGIDTSERALHGALIDCELLAEVYLELVGGRQPGLLFDAGRDDHGPAVRLPAKPRPVPLPPRLSEAEIAAHAAFVEGLGANSLWKTLYDGATTPDATA